MISNNVDGSRENCSSADGRPPIPNSIGGRGAYRHSFNSNGTTPLCTKSLVRHPSLQVKIRSPDISIEPRLGGDDGDAEYMPLLRSGAWADIGSRSNMEDVYVCADNLMHDYGLNTLNKRPSAFYGVTLLF